MGSCERASYNLNISYPPRVDVGGHELMFDQVGVWQQRLLGFELSEWLSLLALAQWALEPIVKATS